MLLLIGDLKQAAYLGGGWCFDVLEDVERATKYSRYQGTVTHAAVPPSKFRKACVNSNGSTTIRFFSSSYLISVYPVKGKSFLSGCPSNP